MKSHDAQLRQTEEEIKRWEAEHPGQTHPSLKSTETPPKPKGWVEPEKP